MIRRAEHGDIPAFMEIAKRLHEATPYARFEMDGPTVAQTMVRFINSRTCCPLVSQRDGELDGFFLGTVQELWWSRTRYATDLAIYYTFGWDLIDMIKEFKSWAFAQPRVGEVTLGVSSGINVDRVGRLYERCGFDNMGGIYTAFAEAS